MSGGDVTAREARLKEIAELIFKSERSARLVIRGTPYELASAVDWLLAELEAADAENERLFLQDAEHRGMFVRERDRAEAAEAEHAKLQEDFDAMDSRRAYEWERAEAAEARLRNLEAERRIGRTPNVCRNDDCSTISYGVGYSCCPGCGGTDGHIGNETRA